MKALRSWGLKMEEFTAWLLGRKLDYEIQAEQAKDTEIGYGEWRIILLLHNRMLYRPANEWERYFPVLDNCCEKGHPLERFRAYEGMVDRWNCNICHAVIPMQTLTSGCRICDWDICISCTTHIHQFFHQFWKERTAPRFLQCVKKSNTAAMTLRKAIKHANFIQERDFADVIMVRSPMFYLCAVTQLKRVSEGTPIARLPIELVRMVSETLGTKGEWNSLGLDATASIQTKEMKLSTQLLIALLIVANTGLIYFATMKTPRDGPARFRMLGEEDDYEDNADEDLFLLVRIYIHRVLEASMYAAFYTAVLAAVMTTLWLCLRPLRVLISPFTSKPASAKHTVTAVVAKPEELVADKEGDSVR